MKPIEKAYCCMIDITSRCALSCLYCSRYSRHLRADQRRDMPLEDLARALDSLKDWPARIGIIGGEPLLYKDLEECCALIASRFPKERMMFLTSGGSNWAKYKPLVERTFKFIAYNEHNPEQAKVCRHQPMTVAVGDVIKNEEYRNELIDDCWVQRTWCPTISVKGAFFCEIAAAQDLLWDGPGGYPVEPGWWKRTPEQFKDQRDRYCRNCGMCLPMERDLVGCGTEKMSPTVHKMMLEHRNLRAAPGADVELYDQQLSIGEVEINKLAWYPGNYREDKCDDANAREGLGSTVFRKL